MKPKMTLEVCVDSVQSARAAEAGGAQRVELCSDLMEGGITPSAGLIDAARAAVAIAMFIMVRPRGGDFCCTSDEFAVMERDVAVAKASGADGVVLGLLLADGRVDVERTGELVALARPMGVTFHRAIDFSLDLEQSLEGVIEAGADRVLTSGGRPSAIEGVTRIAGLVSISAGRIAVMVCGGVRDGNLGEVATKTGAREFHASLRRRGESPLAYRLPGLRLGPAGIEEYARYAVLADDVRAMRLVLDAL